jgi:hypothetical protein
MIFFRVPQKWEIVGLLTSLRLERMCGQGLICTFQDFGAPKSLDEVVFVMNVIFSSRSLDSKARVDGMEIIIGRRALRG